MSQPLQSLAVTGTKVWLDSVDPAEVARNRSWGISGATSNPIIVSDLVKTGHFDDQIARFLREGLDDAAIAWRLTDLLVSRAQEVFLPVWEATGGDDGYVNENSRPDGHGCPANDGCHGSASPALGGRQVSGRSCVFCQ